MRLCSYSSILHLLLSKSIDSGYRVLQISCGTLFFFFYPHTGQRYCTCYYHRQFAIDLFSYLLLLGASHHLVQDFSLPGNHPLLPPKFSDCLSFQEYWTLQRDLGRKVYSANLSSTNCQDSIKI